MSQMNADEDGEKEEQEDRRATDRGWIPESSNPAAVL
jgi:hypothetical protein